MIYKILYFLFSWDYIHWVNTVDSGVARVYVTPDNIVYYWRYKGIKILVPITTASQVTWLTCRASKYGMTDE